VNIPRASPDIAPNTQNADRDAHGEEEAIRHYFNKGFTYDEILALLINAMNEYSYVEKVHERIRSKQKKCEIRSGFSSRQDQKFITWTRLYGRL